MATLAEIRAKLLEQETRKSSGFVSDNAIYAFWNIPEGTTSTLRFLPDGEEENTFFWKERQMIRLAFPGVKGQDEGRNVTVQVPCVEMWGDACPVHAEIRPWFKDPNLENEGRKYWKKRSYIFQGFVVDGTLQEDSIPENPIRRFIINPSIFKIISAALMDPDFPEIPTDYERGTDFKLTKTQKGQYADYSTSNWARRERSLEDDELEAVNSNGLFTLSDYLPKRPSADSVAAIYEMFQASVDGELYDPDKWSDFYRPFGVQVALTDKKESTVGKVVSDEFGTGTVTKVKTSDDVPGFEKEEKAAATTEPSESKSNADEILSMIRSRAKAKESV